MTVTSPPARPPRRRLLAAAAAGAALALSVLTAVPAAAATSSPAPTPTDGVVDTGTVDVTLAPVGNGVLDAGESLTVSVKVHNGTGADLPAGTVSLALGTNALASRSALSSWLDAPSSGIATSTVADVPLADVPVGTDRTRGLTVAADDANLASLAPGVYPLLATVTSGSEETISSSVVIVPDEAATAVDTVLIVPITAGAQSRGLLTSTELAEMTAPGGRLASELDAVDGTNATLAIDPAVLAAIRVLGDNAPATALEWLARLDALPNARFALQFGDADPAVQLEAGLSAPMGPRSLEVFADPDDFGPETAPSPLPSGGPTSTPTPTAEPDEDVSPVPPLDALVEVRAAIPDVYWPASGLAPADVVARLGALGSDDATAITLLSSRATTDGSTGRTVTARSDTEDAQILVYDADASAALSEAAGIEDGVARSAALTAATAQLAFATAQADGRAIAVALDRAVDPTRAGASLAVTAVEQSPGSTTVSMEDVLGTAARRIAVADTETDPARIVDASALFSDEDALERFATIIEDPSLLTGPERAQILQLLGTAWSADPDAGHLAVADHRDATQTTLDSVSLLPASDITLAGSTADLRFWVRNDLPYPVELVLYASSDSLKLSVQSAIPVSATADSNTRVVVPVEARVGSGEVSLDLQLRSRSAVAIGPAEQVLVNVRAEWEGVGIIVMAVLVGALIVLGGVRTVLRLRARRRARARADAGGDESTQQPTGGGERDPDADSGTEEETASGDGA